MYGPVSPHGYLANVPGLLHALRAEYEAGSLQSPATRPAAAIEPANGAAESDPTAHKQILVVISHSSKDKALAEALIDLLRSGLGLLASQIRCSSVDGYRLPAGVNTDDQLRKEIKSASVLVGLLTPNSLSSTYVLFELGARWGAELFLIPLLAGIKPEEMRGPHSVLNALSCETENQLIQLVEDIAKELQVEPQSAGSYLKQARDVKELAAGISFAAIHRLTVEEDMVFEESVYWRRKNGKREGPYCPVCYDHDREAIHLNPGAGKGTYSCGVCRNGFTTGEHDAGPARRRRPYSSRR